MIIIVIIIYKHRKVGDIAKICGRTFKSIKYHTYWVNAEVVIFWAQFKMGDGCELKDVDGDMDNW